MVAMSCTLPDLHHKVAPQTGFSLAADESPIAIVTSQKPSLNAFGPLEGSKFTSDFLGIVICVLQFAPLTDISS